MCPSSEQIWVLGASSPVKRQTSSGALQLPGTQPTGEVRGLGHPACTRQAISRRWFAAHQAGRHRRSRGTRRWSCWIFWEGEDWTGPEEHSQNPFKRHSATPMCTLAGLGFEAFSKVSWLRSSQNTASLFTRLSRVLDVYHKCAFCAGLGHNPLGFCNFVSEANATPFDDTLRLLGCDRGGYQIRGKQDLK